MAPAISPEQLALFQELFRGRAGCYGQTTLAGGKTVKGAAIDQVWLTHLQARGTRLGIVPIMENDNCFFGAIDWDDDKSDHAELSRRVAKLKLPLVVFRSRSGGAHFVLFLDSESNAAELIAVLNGFKRKLLPPKNPDGREIEVFPKQKKLSISSHGNWIHLPYYGIDGDGNTAAYVNGEKLSFEEFLEYAAVHRYSLPQLRNWAINSETDRSLFADGPPCLALLSASGFPEGSRNNGLYNVGVFLKVKYPDEWPEKLRQANQDFMQPPLSDYEVSALAKSLERKDYIYKCRDAPIVSYCRKAECRRMKFGINAFTPSNMHIPMPNFGILTKVLTDPPRFKLPVNGIQVELTGDELASMGRFKTAVMLGANVVVPSMRINEWDRFLQDLLANRQEETVPMDAGTRGQFLSLCFDFFALTARTDSLNDVLRGLPFRDGDNVIFRGRDLMSFMNRHQFRTYDVGQVFMSLETFGVTTTTVDLMGDQEKLWQVHFPEQTRTKRQKAEVPDF